MQHLLQQFEPVFHRQGGGDTGDIGTVVLGALPGPGGERIRDQGEDDGNLAGGVEGGLENGGRNRGDEVGALAHQVERPGLHSGKVICRSHGSPVIGNTTWPRLRPRSTCLTSPPQRTSTSAGNGSESPSGVTRWAQTLSSRARVEGSVK